MQNSTADTIWQIIRYLLIAAGSFAVGKGWVTNDQVTAIVGAIGSVFTVGWGLYIKWNTVPVKAEVADAKNVPTVSSVTGGTVAP